MPLSVSFLVAFDAESDEILGRIIAQAAPRLNVMDLKILRSPAGLAMPAVSLEHCAAELPVVFRL
jgi:hypothetical protein